MAFGTPVAGDVVYSGVANSLPTICPSGVNVNDGLVIVVGHKPDTANTNGGTSTPPAGWSLIASNLAQGGYGATNAADTGNTNLWFYKKDVVDGTEGGQTFTTTLTVTSAAFGFIVHVPASSGQITYGSGTGSRATSPGTSLSVTMGANPGFQSGDIALWAMCIPTDVTTPSQFSNHSITATGATFDVATEFNEPDTTTNNDLGGFSAWARVASGTSTGNPTITTTVGGTATNVRGPVTVVRLREAAPVIIAQSNVRLTSQRMGITAGAQLAISQSNIRLTSEPMRIVAAQPASEGGHYGAYWLKKWEEARKNLSKKVTQKEVLDLVQKQPEQALEVVKEKVKAKFPDVDVESAKTNIKIQRYIAKQIIIEIQLRKAEMDEEDDLETILMLM